MGSGSWRGMPRWPAWRRPLVHLAIVVAFVLTALGSAPLPKSAARASHLPRAGEPLNPYTTAAHIALARADALAGDARGVQAHTDTIAHDLTSAMRVPDVTRPIDHEAARVAVQPLEGVRSAIWIDAINFVVMVDGPQRRSMEMINRVCGALEPLGDTLAVVVNLEDITAEDPDRAINLSRNCQLSKQLALLPEKFR